MIGFALFAGGCNKDKTPLVETGGGMSTGTSSTNPDAGGTETGTTGEASTGDLGAATTGSAGTPGLGTSGGTGASIAAGVNPALNASGEMIKKEDGKPAPEGRVWCDNCKGHLPKEDAVTKNGKTLCPACAEELK